MSLQGTLRSVNVQIAEYTSGPRLERVSALCPPAFHHPEGSGTRYMSVLDRVLGHHYLYGQEDWLPGPRAGTNATPSPATHAIWTQLKAGETADLISRA